MSRLGKSSSRVESKYFFSVSVLVLSVCYPARTFSTLLFYLATESTLVVTLPAVYLNVSSLIFLNIRTTHLLISSCTQNASKQCAVVAAPAEATVAAASVHGLVKHGG